MTGARNAVDCPYGVDGPPRFKGSAERVVEQRPQFGFLGRGLEREVQHGQPGAAFPSPAQFGRVPVGQVCFQPIAVQHDHSRSREVFLFRPLCDDLRGYLEARLVQRVLKHAGPERKIMFARSVALWAGDEEDPDGFGRGLGGEGSVRPHVSTQIQREGGEQRSHGCSKARLHPGATPSAARASGKLVPHRRGLHFWLMPDRRAHRGPHPEDAVLFGKTQLGALQHAGHDLNWLLDRGYALTSSLALTGNRYRLNQRQRVAVARCACSLHQRQNRSRTELPLAALAGRELWLDGYNVLITVEAALAGGVILVGRDGCVRDMASLHGTYREVAETDRAARLIGETLTQAGVVRCHWLLDRPVGNSGRLRARLRTIAEAAGWLWEVTLDDSPDAALAKVDGIVATSDSVVLDHCTRWSNVAGAVIARHVANAWHVDLSGSCPIP